MSEKNSKIEGVVALLEEGMNKGRPSRFPFMERVDADPGILFIVRRSSRYAKGEWTLTGGLFIESMALFGQHDGEWVPSDFTNMRRLRPGWTKKQFGRAVAKLYDLADKDCKRIVKIRDISMFVSKVISDPEYHIAIAEKLGEVAKTEMSSLTHEQCDQVLEFAEGWNIKPVIDLRERGSRLYANACAYVDRVATWATGKKTFTYYVWRPDVFPNRTVAASEVDAKNKVKAINEELGIEMVRSVVVAKDGECMLKELPFQDGSYGSEWVW